MGHLMIRFEERKEIVGTISQQSTCVKKKADDSFFFNPSVLSKISLSRSYGVFVLSLSLSVHLEDVEM